MVHMCCQPSAVGRGGSVVVPCCCAESCSLQGWIGRYSRRELGFYCVLDLHELVVRTPLGEAVRSPEEGLCVLHLLVPLQTVALARGLFGCTSGLPASDMENVLNALSIG